MEPNIRSGQSMGVDKKAYRAAPDVQRGDVIAFRYPESPGHFFVQRVIGLPGENVSLSRGRVSINGAPLPVSGVGEAAMETAGPEKYRILGAGTCEEMADNMPGVQLATDAFFVLGDNRCASRDSRFWGPLAFAFIVGKVVDVR